MTTMQGYLKKKSPRAQGSNKVVDSWQKRYFVLANNQLKYFKTEKDAASSSAEPLKMISLAHVQQAAPNPKHADMFMIDLGSDRKEADRDAWVAALQQSKQEAAAPKDVAGLMASKPAAEQPSPAVQSESAEGPKSDLLGPSPKHMCCVIC